MAVLRHDAAARRRHCRGAGVGEIGVADIESAFGRPQQAGQHHAELALAVALDAGQADDFAGPDLQGEIVDPRRAVAVLHGEAVAHQGEARGAPDGGGGRRRRRARPAATSSGFTSRPTMAWTSAPMSALAMLSSATSRPVRSTATRSATLAISASLCVTRMTARPESATRRQMSSSAPISPGGSTAVGSSSTRSLGSRIRHFTISARWRSPTESSPTTGVGIEREAEALGDVADAGAELVTLQHAPGLAQHQVLDHGHARHQAEMLVHHGDAVLERVGRAGGRPRRAVEASCGRRWARRRRRSGCRASTCRRRSRPAGTAPCRPGHRG